MLWGKKKAIMHKKSVLLILLLFISFKSDASAQFTDSPKRELRGVWIAALGIDWPTQTGTSASVIQNQENELINIFDAHKSYGLNTIFLHMRPICDALYKSNFEPWSSYLTGTQGVPPSDPNYDPLTFAVEEAHKRGMELHAWLNPYRAELSTGSPVSANHVINLHPDWIIKCQGSEYRFLNPGLPAVRSYVVQIIMDIVRRYDIDGIHFDDYFYPYQDYGTFNDDSTFAKYPYGFTDKTEWRKNNVNLLLKTIYDSIKVVKPWIKFGISPSGNPSVNNTIYCDPSAWLSGKYTDSTGTSYSGEPYIDYILPQLYWSRYNNLLASWTGSDFLNGRYLYVGQAAYRFNEFPSDELSWEVTTNRSSPAVKGGVFFSSKSLTNNFGYSNDTLKYHYFIHPAITPKMSWIENGSDSPNPPTNAKFEINSSTGKYELHWDKPAPTPGGDSAFAYIIYRSESNPPNVDDSTNLFGSTGTTFLSSTDARYSVTKGNYYVVSAVDRYSNESQMSNVVTFDSPSLIPGKPQLVTPANGSNDLGLSTTLVWSDDTNAERYVIQVAKDSTFSSNIALWVWEYRNNQINFRNVVPGNVYYWRVKAFGQVGESDYSNTYTFQSGIPLAPVLYSPAHATYDVSLTPQFTWFSSGSATEYRFQLATSIQFYANTIIYDETIVDTTFAVVSPLTPSKNHFWRVSAINDYGTSYWSSTFGFKTTATSDVTNEGQFATEFKLLQNFPNPFNPITEIRFSIPQGSYTTLIVYDILGSKIATLVDETLPQGSYSAKFNATSIPSGVYIYRLMSGGNVAIKKMMLIK